MTVPQLPVGARVVSVGIDVVAVERFAASLRRTPGLAGRLFTPRFWLMCGVSFTAFLAAFQLYPTAPFRILALGGSETAAGMFLGLMTYASALSALFTGALADQVGKRRMLVVCSTAAAICSIAYALIPSVPVMLAVVVVHGIFWSGLMTATGGYLGDIIPAHRRAEGVQVGMECSLPAVPGQAGNFRHD